MDDNDYENVFKVRVFRDRETLKITARASYNENNKLSNLGVPALEHFNRVTGRKTEETYFIDGVPHRNEEEGSSHTEWYPETGNLKCEVYTQYGKHNRSGGKPAVIHYDPVSGDVTNAIYYKNGRKYTQSTNTTNDPSGPEALGSGLINYGFTD